MGENSFRSTFHPSDPRQHRDRDCAHRRKRAAGADLITYIHDRKDSEGGIWEYQYFRKVSGRAGYGRHEK